MLPDDLRLGAVALVVSDLSRSVAWYEEALGSSRTSTRTAWPGS